MIPKTLQTQLTSYGVHDFDEIALREALERHAETYTLIKLAPWPARRWKCRYRLMMGDAFYDAQSVSEVYAMGLLAMLKSHLPKTPTTDTTRQNNA